ncbi:flippase-like domain-containing protein [bacterium]|nr:flippase-like domain-containing protein [bacterium]
MKKYLSLFVKILISAFIIFIILKDIEFSKLVSYFKKFDYKYYWLALALHVVLFLFHFLKWKLLLIPLGVSIPFKSIILICSKGLFFNLFLPTSIGGDVVRMYDANKLSGRWSPSIISIVFERLLGFLSISFLGVCMVIFKNDLFSNNYWRMNLILFPLLLFIVVTLFFSRRFFVKICSFMVPEEFNSKIDKMFKLFEQYRNNLRYVIFALLSVMSAQILNAVIFYLIFAGNHETALLIKSGAIFYFISSLSMIYVISAMPVSFGGAGVREGAFVVFFMSLGFPKAAVTANSLIVTSMLYFVSMFGVIPFLLGYPKRRSE